MKSLTKLSASLLFTLLLAGMLLAPTPLRAEFGYPELNIFPPLIPYVGHYSAEELYDPDVKKFYPAETDLPVAEMLKVDPKTTPYPILMEESWIQDAVQRKAVNIDDTELLIRAKQGSPMALALLDTSGRDNSLVHRMADSLTAPGWSLGAIEYFHDGFHFGDGSSIYNFNSQGVDRERLAAVAGYPEAMCIAGYNIWLYGFGAIGRAWMVESALRGYNNGWMYVGVSHLLEGPADGLPPDLFTAYAAYDIECTKPSMPPIITAACQSRDKIGKKFDEQQLAQAKARSEELMTLWETTQAERLEAQRQHIRQNLPAVVETINAKLDEFLNGGASFLGLTREEAQRVRNE